MQDTGIYNKILFIGPSLKAKGGVAAVLNSYLTEMPGSRFLATTSHKGMLATYLMFALALLKLPFYRLFSDIRIVHIHGASKGSWVRKSIVIRLSKALGFKVIWHCHGGYFTEYAEQIGLDKVRKTLLKCSAIIVLTENWVDFFANKLSLPKVLVVKNIVSRPKTSKVHNTDELRYIFLGEIIQRKGIFDLIESIIKYKSKLSGSFRLIIGGSGEVNKLTQTIAENNIGDCVEFAGWVSGEKKASLLANSDVLILPSYYEGLPISILEAMANEMPIIATPIGGIPDIVKTGVNGVLVTPGNIDEIYSAIKYYIDNRNEVTKQGKTASETISEYYADNVIASLRNLYSKIIG